MIGCVLIFPQPVASETTLESDANLRVVRYGRTPVMSTYLLAFVVGEYDFVEATDADGVVIRVYTPVGKKEQGQFALDVSLAHVSCFIAQDRMFVGNFQCCLVVYLFRLQ